ncbi:N-lysine methyltransferase SETD6 [Ambystoma mexicanum]|uniref:N-lysine methyltransferase SETD6 n=1 Tax=Ambystoma mexicanum TaxID=8296 RepID=UPI0037E7C726
MEAKRQKLSPSVDGPVDGTQEPSSVDISDALTQFLDWCKEMGMKMNPKVCICREGTVSDYGMLAQGNLSAGELLFLVPRSALLSQYTTSISSVLQKEKSSLASDSGWVPLLLSLLYEYTNSASRWKPYFALWPDLKGLDHPMFWPEQERKRLLQGTGVPEVVKRDLENMQVEYFTIVTPFMRNHPDLFQPERHTAELYKKLVAFVMAYSFQEPEEEQRTKHPIPPMMVPVADTLNHVADHNAHLEFSTNYLRMVTTRKITKGQEIFNTYGQMANWQLLHMYGFAEPYPSNTNDAADIQMETMRTAAMQGAKGQMESARIADMWNFLCHMEMVGEEGAFVIGQEEVLTVEELTVTLKVMCFSEEEYNNYKENRGWEEDMVGDAATNTLTNADIAKFKDSWKKLLHASAQLTLQAYTSDLTTDYAIINDAQAYAKLNSRERHALQVRYGQKKILHHLLELTS